MDKRQLDLLAMEMVNNFCQSTTHWVFVFLFINSLYLLSIVFFITSLDYFNFVYNVQVECHYWQTASIPMVAGLIWPIIDIVKLICSKYILLRKIYVGKVRTAHLKSNRGTALKHFVSIMMVTFTFCNTLTARSVIYKLLIDSSENFHNFLWVQ